MTVSSTPRVPGGGHRAGTVGGTGHGHLPAGTGAQRSGRADDGASDLVVVRRDACAGEREGEVCELPRGGPHEEEGNDHTHVDAGLQRSDLDGAARDADACELGRRRRLPIFKRCNVHEVGSAPFDVQHAAWCVTQYSARAWVSSHGVRKRSKSITIGGPLQPYTHATRQHL